MFGISKDDEIPVCVCCTSLSCHAGLHFAGDSLREDQEVVSQIRKQVTGMCKVLRFQGQGQGERGSHNLLICNFLSNVLANATRS